MYQIQLVTVLNLYIYCFQSIFIGTNIYFSSSGRIKYTQTIGKYLFIIYFIKYYKMASSEPKINKNCI